MANTPCRNVILRYMIKAIFRLDVVILLSFLSMCMYIQWMPVHKELTFKNVFWGVQQTERLKASIAKEEKLKKIVYWTPFSHSRDMVFGIGHQAFVNAKCKVSTCTATYLREEVDDADAVLFHFPDFARKVEKPSIRHPHQLYVFFVRQCPAHEYLKNVKQFNNFFNISMTYSREADVLLPFGRIDERGDVPYEPYGKDIMEEKTNFALAVISHCKTGSRREDIIDALKHHMEIDILGACNRHIRKSLNCERNFGMSCMRKIMTTYKFYLSFESHLCRDYASETLYKVMDLPVIPVVYGGSNYSEILPPHSYIDIRDFKTAADLAAYLKEVASDTDKYLSYFTWRKDYQQTVNIEMKPGKILIPDPRAFCDLCEYLHVKRTKKKLIPDMLEVFGSEKYCFSPGTWLTNFVKVS